MAKRKMIEKPEDKIVETVAESVAEAKQNEQEVKEPTLLVAENVEEFPAFPWEYKADVKKCTNCGAEMHGWALRTPFAFCPMCGVPTVDKIK